MHVDTKGMYGYSVIGGHTLSEDDGLVMSGLTAPR